jgi:two-component system sensor histidine kinase KdpD
MSANPFILSNTTRKSNKYLIIALIISSISIIGYTHYYLKGARVPVSLFLPVLCILILLYILIQFEKSAFAKQTKENKLKLYETLLNALSHELRTPISVIMGATDNLLLENSTISPEDKKGLLTEISTASLKLNQQVENLLNTSRLQSGFLQLKKDWCDIDELIHNVIHQLNDQLKDHVVNIAVKQHIPLFKIDRGLIDQVLYNLLSNAAQYTPASSVITITANNTHEQLLLIVEDNGKGISEKEANKVFDKFYRVDNAIEGRGLGLSIVKGFIEVHNGSITLEKSVSGGAKFIIKIPAKTILLKTT